MPLWHYCAVSIDCSHSIRLGSRNLFAASRVEHRMALNGVDVETVHGHSAVAIALQPL